MKVITHNYDCNKGCWVEDEEWEMPSYEEWLKQNAKMEIYVDGECLGTIDLGLTNKELWRKE